MSEQADRTKALKSECAVVGCLNMSNICNSTIEVSDVHPDTKPLKIENALPNGKIKHKPNENGIVPHILTSESPKLQLSSDDVCSCSCGSENETTDTTCTESSHKGDNTTQNSDNESSLCDIIQQLELENPSDAKSDTDFKDGIQYIVYESELQMPDIMRLITKDLSEPYSIYTYRYFIHNWPKLCFLVSLSF